MYLHMYLSIYLNVDMYVRLTVLARVLTKTRRKPRHLSNFQRVFRQLCIGNYGLRIGSFEDATDCGCVPYLGGVHRSWL